MMATRLVQDASHWHLMDGETPAIQKVNSLLTTRLVFPKEMPADECVEEARHLAILWDKGQGWEKAAERYLMGQFATGMPFEGGEPRTVIPNIAAGIPAVIQQIGQILAGRSV